MNGRRILAAVFLLPALGASYMTWVTWRAGDSGQWLFGVFAIFFLALSIAPQLPDFPKKQPEPVKQTGFGPHWFMMLAILALSGVAVAAIVGAILRH